ncbi:uncharacterized protein LOC101858857, partial [Aplysia californica]|uniref:Uncharacterized protein LOC101858857 n=1 Tax=Aplysia californica TaxID=6500 RepID=A0ABM0JNC1_APLCA
MISGSVLPSFGAAVFLGCLLVTVSGSIIQFEASSDVVQASLTHTLTMRCSLKDTAPPLAAPVVGRRDVTETTVDMKYVSSMVVMRNDIEHVAMVTVREPGKALLDQDNLQVTGSLETTSGHQGSLALVWQYPTEKQAGTYKCEVNGIDLNGHNVRFSKTLHVNATKPTIDDLAGHLATRSKMIDQLTSTVNQLTNDLADMQARLENDTHSQITQTGTLSCGHMSSNGAQNVTQLFEIPYKKPPVVTLGMQDIHIEIHGNYNIK